MQLLVAVRHASAVARRSGLRRAGHLCAAQGPRHVRALGETQRRTRLARDRVGAATAGAELLLLACLRRTGRQRQAADESAANPRCADRAAVKLRSSDNDAQARSYRWRSTTILGVV